MTPSPSALLKHALTACLWWGTALVVSAAAWPVERQWGEREELGYARWIEKLGGRSWRSADRMLHDPVANSLFDASDSGISFRADCGDLPFVLRAYYAYKRRLPMIISEVDGGNYSITPNRTVSQINNLTFAGDAAAFFRDLPNRVETGTLRTDPYDRDTACYPVVIRPQHVRPGAVFYDPNGHAAVVCGVDPDGTVRLIDAHPDQSVTRIVFGEKLRWATASHRGGFLRFRPVRFQNGTVYYENRLRELPGFGTEQYTFREDYHLRVKMRLASRTLDPVRDLEKHIHEDTYQEALDRVAAVELGWKVGKDNAIPVPPNIYSCTGPWEDFATPGRDIRLRISFLSIPTKVAGYLKLANSAPDSLVPGARDSRKLAASLLRTQERLFAQLSISYANSKGEPVRLTLDDIERRLFRLSFDPNHPPELRWGASGRELASAARELSRYYDGYELQQPWRNRLERQTGVMYPSDDGNPRAIPEHDITAMIRRLTPPKSTGGRD